MDAFESAHTHAVQPPTRSPPPGAAHVNMQNIREFNQLKYRGNNGLSQFSVQSICLKCALDCSIMRIDTLPAITSSFLLYDPEQQVVMTARQGHTMYFYPAVFIVVTLFL